MERHIWNFRYLHHRTQSCLGREGDHKKTRQLISATGALPGGSPIETEPGKFNGIARILKIIVEGNSARYEFIGAEKREILWSNIKIENGLRQLLMNQYDLK